MVVWELKLGGRCSRTRGFITIYCPMYFPLVIIPPGAHVGTVVQQQLHDFWGFLLICKVQWSLSVFASRIDVRTILKE